MAGLESLSQPKVPTVICYNEDASSFTWGGQKHNGYLIEGVKLLLDPRQDRPAFLPQPRRYIDVPGKSVVDIAADFIGAVYEHAMKRIESKVPADYLNMCQKRFVLSVPAVWSDKAKALTQQVIPPQCCVCFWL